MYSSGSSCGRPCVRPEGCRIHWKTKSRFPCAVCGKPTGSSSGRCQSHIGSYYQNRCLLVKNFWLEHEWLKSSNESILEYHKNSMPQWIAESCHRYQVITYQESRLGGLGIEKQTYVVAAVPEPPSLPYYIMETNDTGSSPITTPTITILRRDFQAAAAPNTSPEFIKKYPTNRAMIDAVNNLLLETYHSYTGRARMTGSNESKRLVIHFNSSKERDDCLSQQFADLADLRFFLHDPQQLRTNEDLCAIQVTDIPFFIKKDDVAALFKKYGNIQSCRLYSRANAKVQQARIVYDDAQSIAHFQDKQWAIYCYSTCLRITPCSLTLEQKKSRHEFVAVLSQLPPNTKDVHLAPLIREIGAMAVNIPLSLNSYKPKKWAYVTFRSQQMMDTAMEQSVAFQGGMLQWEFPKDINKLCHRCGKLGCAPTACPMNNSRGRSRTRNPIAYLKERFNIGQSNKTPSASHGRQRSRSQSKDSVSTRSFSIRIRGQISAVYGYPDEIFVNGSDEKD
ncbi:unnamed protein product [Rhizophagus irregularis]|nr:unnamed protein product [Rhizophagus irregularis]